MDCDSIPSAEKINIFLCIYIKLYLHIYMKKKILDNNLIIFILVIVLLFFLNYDNIVDYFSIKEGLTKKEKEKEKEKERERREKEKQLQELKTRIIGDYKGKKEVMSKDEFINLLTPDRCSLIKEYIDIMILLTSENKKVVSEEKRSFEEFMSVSEMLAMATIYGFIHLKNKKCNVIDHINDKTSETKITLDIGGGVESTFTFF